jgi:hypothetical protein
VVIALRFQKTKMLSDLMHMRISIVYPQMSVTLFHHIEVEEQDLLHGKKDLRISTGSLVEIQVLANTKTL